MNNRVIHREKVGGLRDEMGKLQFDYLIKNGLKPEHKFLDIACGSFRAGRFLIEYLNTNNYYGIDADFEVIEDGKRYEINSFIDEKAPIFYIIKSLNFQNSMKVLTL